MRIYLQPPQPSRGLQRIADALTRYLPDGWETTPHIGGADLVILYAIGRRDRLQQLTDAINKSKFTKYAIIQVCLRSTMSPDTCNWLPIWEKAVCIWSYYDLIRLTVEDNPATHATDDDKEFAASLRSRFNFYHAPLGADAGVFYYRGWKPEYGDYNNRYVIATSGLSRLSESVRECHLAASRVDRYAFHLGPKVDDAFSVSGISDDELARYYSQCEFVSGLRRKEGFELPAVEGLLCGARPIVFNTPDYHWAYGNHALYIEETDRQGVIDQLVQLFRHGAPPITPEERELAVARYDWKTIVGGFYECLH